MKKSSERRSMTYALVCYSRLGGDIGCLSALDVYKRISGVWAGNEDIALDVWAVHECIMFLRLNGEHETIRAIREIYVEPFSKDIHSGITKNEISSRILRFALKNNLDERTVYRRLQKARGIWLAIREYGRAKKEGTLK